jgi:hypothetical protein
VLDPRLQGTTIVPKFTPRSRRGVFVGFSRRHSSTVPLVLNLSTLSITPQFHIIFDDWFTSVSSSSTSDELDSSWLTLFSDSKYQYHFDDDDDVALDHDWAPILSSLDSTHNTNLDTLLTLQRKKEAPCLS